MNRRCICGSPNSKQRKGYEKDYLVKCVKCGTTYANRIPSTEELIKCYQTEYNRSDYLSPITIKRYHQILDQFEKVRKTNNLLDVGCGIGYFLEIAKQRGWNVYGTEFMDDAIAICANKGISMKKGSVHTSFFEPEMFDVITSIEVIEHIMNPTDDMKHITALLRKGGLFFFTTPNFNSLSRYLLKEKWTIIHYPEHLTYFTPSSIKRLLKKEGLKKQWMKTSGISLTRFENSKEGKQGPVVHQQASDEKLRVAAEKNPLVGLAKNGINFMLNLTHKGDSIKGLFYK